LTARLGHEPSEEQVASEAKLPLEQVRATRAAPRAVASLDRPLGNENGGSFGDLLSREVDLGPEEQLSVALTEEMIQRALAELPGMQRQVLKLRYGLDGDPEPVTRAEVARRIGQSVEEVRELETEALDKLAVNREIASLREAA
jgi:RNA polymerase primary sigma factor